MLRESFRNWSRSDTIGALTMKLVERAWSKMNLTYKVQPQRTELNYGIRDVKEGSWFLNTYIGKYLTETNAGIHIFSGQKQGIQQGNNRNICT